MSERLEDYVKKHRDDFDFLEPNAALWNKIETKLGPERKSRSHILWKAAAVILVFGFSFWAQMQIGDKNQTITQHNIHTSAPELAQAPEIEEMPVASPEPEKNQMIPEFTETEKYYNRKVNSTMKELKVYLVKYPDVATDMKKDLAELDSVYRTLKHDLGDNVAQEEIISAMIQNYRMKLQLLEDIKSELMRSSATKNNSKNKNNESHVL